MPTLYSSFSTLIKSFSDLNTLIDGGIWYRNLPTDSDENVDWTKNYIAWDCNVKEIINTNDGGGYKIYDVLVVIMTPDSEDQLDLIVESVLTNINTYSSSNISYIKFESENKYTKLEEGQDGIYISELLFSIIK